MDDYFDDFGDDFSDDFDDDFGDDGDYFSDESDDGFEMDEPLDDVSGIENEPTGDDICDDKFTVEDAVRTGIACGWGYAEGKKESERRNLIKKAEKENKKKEDL